MTGMRDAMERAIMSLLAGAMEDVAVEGPAGPDLPHSQIEETRPSQGPSKASFMGGSCLETSLEAYRRGGIA